jgi:pimeloyl-ACP methyl ester carboxylesterase
MYGRSVPPGFHVQNNEEDSIMIAFLLQILKTYIAVLIAASLFTYAVFWYENAAPDRSLRISGKYLPFVVLRGILSSIATLFLASALYPYGLLRPSWKPKTLSPDQPVIILVHGLYHNSSAWLPFLCRLKSAGFHNVYAFSYGSFFTSFEASFRKLERFLASVRRDITNQPIILIGHSLGGLLSRVYAERAQTVDIPELIITLGTPHQGSKMAAFGVGKLAGSLAFRGPLFTEIEKGPSHLPCPGVAFFSPADNLVLPSEALRAPYPGWLYEETAPLSHIAMIFSNGVTRRVIEVIREQSRYPMKKSRQKNRSCR